MTTPVAPLNNEAAQLIAQGKIDRAEKVLERVRAILAGRAQAVPDVRDLDPALDEYFYRSHRLHLAWLRQLYRDALPHAERAYSLERGMLAAARDAKVDDLAPYAFSMGAWGLISALTRLGRFEDAEKIFAEVVADEDFFRARLRRERASAERVLIAGLCVFFEKRDEGWMKRGRQLVAKAQGLASPDDPELVFGYACFWARLGEVKQACDALEDCLRRGVDPERMLADDDLKPLQENPRFQSVVMDRVFTFKVSSVPTGAQLWIDERGTGLRTPVRMRPPPPGRHLLRLKREGYRDAEHTHEQQKGVGLDLSLRLESLADIAERERLVEESLRPVDALARTKTRAFLGTGSELRKARITVVRQTTYGLGELRMTVHGDGRALVRHETFSTPSEVFSSSVGLEDDEVRALFDAFVDEAFSQLVIAPHCGVPDELYFTLELANARGEAHRLGKFVQTGHPRFERLVALVHQSIARHLDAATRQRLTV